MSKLSKWGRRFWLKVELAAPPAIQRTVMPRLHEAKDMTRLLFKPYLTVWQWQGQSEAGPLVVDYAGSGRAKGFLKRILFAEEPIVQEKGKVPVWQLNKLAKAVTGDITIVEADRRLIKQLPTQQAFTLPSFVEMILDTDRDWENLENTFRKSARNERARVRKYGYEYEISHKDQDFELFYHKMYLPTMENRHGHQAVLMPKREAYQYFRHGLLFLTKRNGQPVSGGICNIEQGILSFILMGILDGNQELMKEGAAGALNYLRVQWANQNGYTGVNFGYCRPFMSSLFHNKRKWGTKVVVPSKQTPYIWIRLQQNTPSVVRFMKNTPFIILNNEHDLFGLITVDDSNAEKTQLERKLNKQFKTPGLKGLFVCSMNDFFTESMYPFRNDALYSINQVLG